MPAEYKPYIIGLNHDNPKKAREVAEIIIALGVKSAGLEYDKEWSEEEMRSQWDKSYFGVLTKILKEHGIRVDFLKSKALVKKEKKITKYDWWNRHTDAPGIHNFEQAFLKDTVTRKMEEEALKTKPELLAVGSGHALPMREDMKIPKSKFTLMDFPPEHFDYFRKELISIRRLRRKRRTQKTKRIKPR